MKPEFLISTCDRFVVGRYLCGPSVSEMAESIGTANAAEDRTKRALDFACSAMLLVLLSPLFLIVALAIKAEGDGPIFFKQRRAGLGGKVFLIYKFRSMNVVENGAKIAHATKNDQRVTRVGAFIRSTSIDELPQLINVLRSEMSLIGPRPHALAHDSLYRSLLPTYQWRFRARPGLTGLAQVRGLRGEIHTLDDMDKRVAADREYAENWSLLLDLGIALKTIPCLLTDKAAY